MYIIEAKNSTKIFKGKKENFKALDRVSLNVKKGEIYGLLGPNGAGKTTLIYILSTLMSPTKGTAKVLGYNLSNQSNEIRNKINACFGGTQFFWSFTPKEILTYYGMLYGIKRAERNEKINELAKVLKFDTFVNKKFHKLSKGMKQKVAIAKSLINDPELLFMDEPTVGLDVDVALDVRMFLRDLVKEKNVSILLTSHYMQEVEIMCKNISILNRGRIIKEGNVNKIEKSYKFPEIIWLYLKRYDNLSFLKKLKYVKNVTVNKEGLFVEVEQAHKSVSKLLGEFKKRRIKVLDIEIKKATLEDAFLRIIGGKNV